MSIQKSIPFFIEIKTSVGFSYNAISYSSEQLKPNDWKSKKGTVLKPTICLKLTNSSGVKSTDDVCKLSH